MILKKRCYVINGRRNVISGNIYDVNGEDRLYFNKFYCIKLNKNLNKFNDNTIKTFDSSKEASRITGIHQTSVVANGKTARGYIWKWEDVINSQVYKMIYHKNFNSLSLLIQRIDY